MRSFAPQVSRQPGPAAQLSWTAPALRSVRTSARGHASGVGESAEAARQEPQTTPDPSFLHDFGRIAIHAAPPAIQFKLRVGAPGDAHEREADQVAEQVMRMPEPRPQPVLRPSYHGGHVEAPAVVHDVLRSPGHPLDASTQAFMEPRFGHDFSRVRVHADPRAAQAAESISARAFTVSRDIVFGAGEYAPQTDRGRRLLSHELAHVVQQGSASAASLIQRAPPEDEPPVVTSPVVNLPVAAPLVAAPASVAVAAATTITLTSGVGGKGPNVVSDLKQIQARLLQMGYFSAADYTAESVTLLKDLMATDKVAAASIPRTVEAIKTLQRTAEYADKPTGQISPTGTSLALMNAQIAQPTAADLTAITTKRAALTVTSVVGGDLTLAGKVGKVTGGNLDADVVAVQQRLNGMGLLKAAHITAESPAAIRAAHRDQYKAGVTSIDPAHLPETIKSIQAFQTTGRFEHSIWSARKFAGTDLSTLKWTAGEVAEGDLSEFILSHYQKTTFGFKDAAGTAQTLTTDNFVKSKYTRDASGVGIAGAADPATFTVDEFKAYGITDVEARALLFVSKNEGKFNALNTYDRAAVSFGFVQFAGGSGGGTFPRMLANLKKNAPAVFKNSFGDFGIDVEYTEKDGALTAATVVAIDPVGGTVLRGRDAEAYIRKTPALVPTFLSAGYDKEVQKAQVKTAVTEYVIPSRSLKLTRKANAAVLKYKSAGADVVMVGPAATAYEKTKAYKDLPAADKQGLSTFTLAGDKISDYLSSEKARAVIIDQSINMGPGGAADKLSRGVNAYVVAQKQIDKSALKTASETDILTSFKPFAFISDRVQKAIDDASLSN